MTKIILFGAAPIIVATAGLTRRSMQPAVCLARRMHVKVVCLVAAVPLIAGVAACGTQAAGQPAGSASAATASVIPSGTVAASPPVVGTASVQPPNPAPGSTPPTLFGPVTLTTADNGTTVLLQVGQQVAVALAAEGLFSWHVPTSVGAAVMRVDASGGYPGQQPAQAAFLAVRSGRATLTAIDDTGCLHTQPACEPPQQEWRVTIIVTGS